MIELEKHVRTCRLIGKMRKYPELSARLKLFAKTCKRIAEPDQFVE